MKRLIESGLHGNGLIPLETPLLLRRYNDCLKAIGQEPTRLRKIHIDGMGWSPEVAAEKDEVYYLANGEANPYAIIITPDQKGMPIHYPHHSFDRDLIRAIFKVAGKQVSDLTSQTGLWVELDQQFDIYTSPDDLATIDVIIVRVNAVDDLMDVARTQKTLVHSIRQEDGWMDDGLRDALHESGGKYGDLRFRSLIIPDIPYTEVQSYYTRVFGGVYVFREHLKNSSSLMILETDQGHVDRDDVMDLSDKDSVIDRLISEGLLVCDINLFAGRCSDLLRIRDTLLTKKILEVESGNKDFKMPSLGSPQRKAYLQSLGTDLPDEYPEIKRVAKMLEKGTSVDTGSLSEDLRKLIIRPCVRFEEDRMLFVLLMRLVASLVTVPYELLYAYNKPLFFDSYARWSNAEQLWSIEQITKNPVEEYFR